MPHGTGISAPSPSQHADGPGGDAGGAAPGLDAGSAHVLLAVCDKTLRGQAVVPLAQLLDPVALRALRSIVAPHGAPEAGGLSLDVTADRELCLALTRNGMPLRAGECTAQLLCTLRVSVKCQPSQQPAG